MPKYIKLKLFARAVTNDAKKLNNVRAFNETYDVKVVLFFTRIRFTNLKTKPGMFKTHVFCFYNDNATTGRTFSKKDCLKERFFFLNILFEIIINVCKHTQTDTHTLGNAIFISSEIIYSRGKFLFHLLAYDFAAAIT